MPHRIWRSGSIAALRRPGLPGAAFLAAVNSRRLTRSGFSPLRTVLLSKFGEQGVIDLLGVVGYYNFLAIVMNATRTALPDNVAEPLKRYPV
jgi:4-carboxymuconolactone decarboxylase